MTSSTPPSNTPDPAPKKRKMGIASKLFVAIAVVFGLFVLAKNLETSESRAEKHYQSALALIAQGDEARATIELENVFQLNSTHRAAREAYADLALDKGDAPESYRHYLILAEQNPDDLDIRDKLVTLALRYNFLPNVTLVDEIRRHASTIIEAEPDTPRGKKFALIKDYFDPTLRRNSTALDNFQKRLQESLAKDPEEDSLRRLLISVYAAQDEDSKAIEELDILLKKDPESLDYNALKLSLLERMGNTEAIGEQLETLYEKAPDNAAVQDSLVRWYNDTGKQEKSEQFLRELSKNDPKDDVNYVKLLDFIRETKDDEIILQEIDKAIAATEGNPETEAQAVTYKTIKANVYYAQGKIDEAVALLQSILPEEGTKKSYFHDARAAYAAYLDFQGKREEAQKQIDIVLENDPSNIAALNLNARWKIENDQNGDAIIDLRTALGQDPKNTETILLMAVAYSREGAIDLAGERLAVATEYSGYGPVESLMYVDFLLSQGNSQEAEKVLIAAQRANPRDVGIIVKLGDVLSLNGSDTGATEVIDHFLESESKDLQDLGVQMKSSYFLRKGETEYTLSETKKLMEAGEPVPFPMLIGSFRTYLENGNLQEAQALLDSQLAIEPDDIGLRLLQLDVYAAEGDMNKLEEASTNILKTYPGDERAFQSYVAFLAKTGRVDEIDAFVDSNLQSFPNSFFLSWIKASRLEEEGKIEDALRIYEKIYRQDRTNSLVVNNLSSLLSNYTNDKEKLDYAFNIAKRLRGSTNPSFVETYAWIQYRRGNFNDALQSFEKIKDDLSDSGVFQLHFGLTQAALGQTSEAQQTLTKALQILDTQETDEVRLAQNTLERLAQHPEGTSILAEDLVLSKN